MPENLSGGPPGEELQNRTASRRVSAVLGAWKNVMGEDGKQICIPYVVPIPKCRFEDRDSVIGAVGGGANDANKVLRKWPGKGSSSDAVEHSLLSVVYSSYFPRNHTGRKIAVYESKSIPVGNLEAYQFPTKPTLEFDLMNLKNKKRYSKEAIEKFISQD